jgi:hypothetical protein
MLYKEKTPEGVNFLRWWIKTRPAIIVKSELTLIGDNENKTNQKRPTVNFL